MKKLAFSLALFVAAGALFAFGCGKKQNGRSLYEIECAYENGVLEGSMRDRARHVIYECERVRLAVAAMKAGDMEGLGDLLNRSHQSLSKLYDVTGRELDALAGAAREHPACAGSRMTGAGFGGCTVSLVLRDGVEDFKAYVSAAYEKATGYRAAFYDCTVDDGITVEKI